jgi:hypothetical protein
VEEGTLYLGREAGGEALCKPWAETCFCSQNLHAFVPLCLDNIGMGMAARRLALT